jgi:hypothetical protein
MFALPFFGFSESLFRVAIRLALLLRASLRLRGDGLTQSVVLLRPDFPEIDTSLDRHGLGPSRRSKLGNDAVDGAPTTADNKHVLYYAMGGASGDAGHVQLDLLAHRAVGIDRVAAGLAASEAGRAHGPKVIGTVINLCEVALTVKPPDANDKIRDPYWAR